MESGSWYGVHENTPRVGGQTLEEQEGVYLLHLCINIMLALFLDLLQFFLLGLCPLLPADQGNLFNRSATDELDDCTLGFLCPRCLGVVDEAVDGLLYLKVFDRGVG